MTETALRKWIKHADIEASDGPPGALTTPEREELERLHESATLQKSRDLLRAGERVRIEFIDAENGHHPALVLCAVLLVARSGYYA